MEKVKPHSLYPERKGQVISLEKGKLPPQAVDLEEVVLGAMMIDKKGVDEVIDILHPEVFYKDITYAEAKVSLACLNEKTWKVRAIPSFLKKINTVISKKD